MNKTKKVEVEAKNEAEKQEICKFCERTENEINDWKYLPIFSTGVCVQCYKDIHIQNYKKLMKADGLNNEYPLIHLNAIKKEFNKEWVSINYIDSKIRSFLRSLAGIELLKQQKANFNENKIDKLEYKTNEYEYRLAGEIIVGNEEGIKAMEKQLKKYKKELEKELKNKEEKI